MSAVTGKRLAISLKISDSVDRRTRAASRDLAFRFSEFLRTRATLLFAMTAGETAAGDDAGRQRVTGGVGDTGLLERETSRVAAETSDADCEQRGRERETVRGRE